MGAQLIITFRLLLAKVASNSLKVIIYHVSYAMCDSMQLYCLLLQDSQVDQYLTQDDQLGLLHESIKDEGKFDLPDTGAPEADNSSVKKDEAGEQLVAIYTRATTDFKYESDWGQGSTIKLYTAILEIQGSFY